MIIRKYINMQKQTH